MVLLSAGKGSAKNTSEWSGGDMRADELIDQALNMKVPTVRVPVGDDGKTVVDHLGARRAGSAGHAAEDQKPIYGVGLGIAYAARKCSKGFTTTPSTSIRQRTL